MSNIKIYIDLATRFGWTIYKDNKIVKSGWVDLANDRTIRPMYKRSKQEQMEEFSDWLFLLLYDEIEMEHEGIDFIDLAKKENIEFIIEQPNTTGVFNSRKTLALFGICDLVIGEYREIKNSVWFKWCIETYPHLVVNKTPKKVYKYHWETIETNDDNKVTKVKVFNKDEDGNRIYKIVEVIDRKKTSIATASYILDKEIKDDNEADAICMTACDNKIIKKIE